MGISLTSLGARKRDNKENDPDTSKCEGTSRKRPKTDIPTLKSSDSFFCRDTKASVSTKDQATRSEHTFLSEVARGLAERSEFDVSVPDPKFGDVLKALGFNSEQDIGRYFETKTNHGAKYKKRDPSDKPMEHQLEPIEWRFLRNIDSLLSKGILYD